MAKNLTKAELVSNIANATDSSKSTVESILTSLVENITDALKQDKGVALSNLGTFSVGKRKARTGRNPKTGATIQIAASNATKFKVSSKLKEALN